MITGWVVKVLLTIAVLGLIVLEVGSPLVAKAQADAAAHQVADEAAFRLRTSFLQTTLDDACASEAAEQSVRLDRCVGTPQGLVTVAVTKQARKFLLGRLGPLERFYVVEASATATTAAPE